MDGCMLRHTHMQTAREPAHTNAVLTWHYISFLSFLLTIDYISLILLTKSNMWCLHVVFWIPPSFAFWFPNQVFLSLSSLKAPTMLSKRGCRVGRVVDRCEGGRRRMACFIAGDSPYGYFLISEDTLLSKPQMPVSHYSFVMCPCMYRDCCTRGTTAKCSC